MCSVVPVVAFGFSRMCANPPEGEFHDSPRIRLKANSTTVPSLSGYINRSSSQPPVALSAAAGG
jgi:hypothetical protein